MVTGNAALHRTRCEVQHTSCLCSSPAVSCTWSHLPNGARVLPTVRSHIKGTAIPQFLLAGTPGYLYQLSAGAVPLLFQKRGVLTQQTRQKHLHSKQSSLETNKAATRGWKKKDQVFLSEQQLISQTRSITVIFNKMLLFNIVYYKQAIVLFSWTIHTYALKNFMLKPQTRAYFSRTVQWHYLTDSLGSCTGQTSVISDTRYREICFQELVDSHTKFFVLMVFW